MDNAEEDQRLPHMADPDSFVDLEEIKKKTGVLYWKVNVVGQSTIMISLHSVITYQVSGFFSSALVKS